MWKNTLLFNFLLLLTFSTFSHATDAQILIQKHCVSCHTLKIPTASMVSSFKAPPMNAVMLHINAEIKNEQQQEEFIINYALHPEPKNSICESNKVQRFGVMPSLKGIVSKKELKSIAKYLVKYYPTEEFIKMHTEMKLYKKINELRKSPFLINQKGLPFLTKLLMENWGKGKLSLSHAQKRKLLEIRYDTVRKVMKNKEQIEELEADVIEMVVDGDDDLETIEITLHEIATLKVQTTLIQLKCLKKTIKLLNEKQLETLLPMWGMY